MHFNQYPYYELHHAMLSSSGDFRFESLVAWIDQNSAEVDWLRTLSMRNGPHTHVPREELWRLYALSRVVQLITLSFQTGNADGSSWPGPGLSRNQFSSFANDLGLAVFIPEHFSPFDCEIVSAMSASDYDAPIDLVKVHWPCLMLGEMLICRAGTSVTGGANLIDESIATSSRLYWAYRRKTRPHEDLSHGWGRNSQWRTSFRRDYRVGSRVYFNVDGKHDLLAEELTQDEIPSPPLTRDQRIELLTNRCFIITTKPSRNLWPYDDRITMDT